MTDREALREKVASELANDMGEVVDRTWKFYLRGADAAIAVVLERAARVADEMGYECEGCGHLCGNPQTDMAIIKKAGGLSCCPERKMRPLGSAIRALIAPLSTQEPLT